MRHESECVLSSSFTRSDNFVPLAVGVVVKLILCLEDYVRTFREPGARDNPVADQMRILTRMEATAFTRPRSR